jgi:hypothetical protein
VGRNARAVLARSPDAPSRRQAARRNTSVTLIP